MTTVGESGGGGVRRKKKSTSSGNGDAADIISNAADEGFAVETPTKVTAPAKNGAAAPPAASNGSGGAFPMGPLNAGAAIFPVTKDPASVPTTQVIYAAPETFKAHAPIMENFMSLSYGPSPEESDAAYAWLNKHNRKFGHFIGNKWVKPEGRSYRASTSPATRELLAETIDGTTEDVDLAVRTARAAYGPWSALSGHERAKYMYAIARHVQKHHRLLAVIESLDNGKSIRETRDSDIPLVARHFYHHAGWAQVRDEEYPGWSPLGVIGEIVPWNFPLMLLAWKVCPALAMGNTVVVKPASFTRMSALLFAEIVAEAGLPPGVFNLITGPGSIGSDLADHPDIDKVAFTGSTPVGRLLRERIAGSGKKISLELGGKSPVIVFDSADLDAAVEGVVDAIWFNQGQVCCAGSRLIVQESIYERFMKKLKLRMDKIRVGHPLDKGIDMAALADESQYKSIKGFVERAVAEGAEVYVSRSPVPNNGWYWPPTIISNVSPGSECVREEVFGPVLAILTFRDPDEAIKLANNTFFGLGGSVWSENISLALEVALNIKAGAIWINAHNLFDSAAGFGGYKESGFGRDGGREGNYEYLKPSWQKRPRPALKFPTQKAVWTSVVMPSPASVEEANAGHSRFDHLDEAGIAIDKTHKLYIGGKQVRPDQAYSRAIISPQGELLGHVGEGNRKDVRNAVEAAHAASAGWGKRGAHNRAQIAFYVAENLQRRFDEFVKRIELQTGRSHESAVKEVNLSVERLFYYAAYADKFGGYVQETPLNGATVAVHEPVGVVGILCPDEYPLLGFVSLFAPAVVRANTIVIVPSTKFPLSVCDLYEVFETSDLPPGVVNIVTGERDYIAKTLTEHKDVEAVWYFGSADGSRDVEFAASGNMKRTWVNYGEPRDWEKREQGQGSQFLREAVELKNVWIPMGEAKGTGAGY